MAIGTLTNALSLTPQVSRFFCKKQTAQNKRPTCSAAYAKR